MKTITKRLFIALGISLVLYLVLVLLDTAGFFNTFENRLLDTRFRVCKPVPRHPDVLVVEIDEITEKLVGAEMPFDRAYHGEFIRVLGMLGAKAVVFDVAFPFRDTPDEGTMAMAASMHRYKNVYTSFLADLNLPERDDLDDQASGHWKAFMKKGLKITNRTSYDRSVNYIEMLPDSLISNYSNQVGFFTVENDRDGVLRRIIPSLRYRGKRFIHFCLAGVCGYMGVEPDSLIFKKREIIIPNAVTAQNKKQDIKIPLDKEGKILINWAGRWEASFLPHYSYGEIMAAFQDYSEGREKSGLTQEELLGFKDKIVVIGATTQSAHDYYPVPVQSDYFSMGVQVNLVNMILQQRFMKTPFSLARIALLVIMMLLTVSIIRLHWIWTIIISLFILLCYNSAAFFLFSKSDVWLLMVLPNIGIILTLVLITTFSNVVERSEKARVMGAFKSYISPDLLKRVMDTASLFDFSGRKKEVTILFGDIKHFSIFCDTVSPDHVITSLSRLLREITTIIMDSGGYIDKFIGDGIMAIYGDPVELSDHAQRAVDAAIRIQKRIYEIGLAEKQWGDRALAYRIGIHTGEVTVGNVGTEERMEYTALGKNVNIAARLEGAATPNCVLISSETMNKVKIAESVEDKGGIMVKGSSAPIHVFEINPTGDKPRT
ncbi:MAG: adenylate/guanylate cyclase domain-containing protein [bacterium]